MGEVVAFKAKKLSGFIPDELPEPLDQMGDEMCAEIAVLIAEIVPSQEVVPE